MKKLFMLFSASLCFILLILGCDSNTERSSPIVVFVCKTLLKHEEYSNDNHEYLVNKYVRDYYIYSNGKYIGKAAGEINYGICGWRLTFSGYSEGYKLVAFSEKVNPYPRKIIYKKDRFPKEFDIKGGVPAELKNLFGFLAETLEMYIIDLDGDGSNEYIVLMANEKENFFAKLLVDSEFNIVAYLTVFHEKFECYSELVKDNLRKTVEVIDIDNDGNMEILVEMVAYEGFDYNMYLYKNGYFFGDYINFETVMP